jgi:hypothetical protein
MRRFFEVWLREDRTPAATFEMLDTQLKNLTGRLSSVEPVARAARRPAPVRPMSTLIKLDTAVGTTREYVVKVRNERAVPLEAWGATIAEARTGRRLRAIGRDTVTELTSDVPAGVLPGAVIEIGTYQPDTEVAGGLTVYLEFAMWKDLEWQGWDFHQQRTLASRERKAEEYAFFIGPLLEAAALPAPKAVELLRARQQEHRQGPLGRQSSGLQNQLAEWERVAATKPSTLAEQLKAYAAALERDRTTLLRHRK